eukprot:5167997-Alexandrium_andersonii.AAC.1
MAAAKMGRRASQRRFSGDPEALLGGSGSLLPSLLDVGAVHELPELLLAALKLRQQRRDLLQ